ncbi:conserved protein, unknown function [Hepatocystis sp. ex Piliocolobus tephrosceles]|nr:conserved protein, unknown function [Hepatocystis sp. ex Piliocolobus tephrosceles]
MLLRKKEHDDRQKRLEHIIKKEYYYNEGTSNDYEKNVTDVVLSKNKYMSNEKCECLKCEYIILIVTEYIKKKCKIDKYILAYQDLYKNIEQYINLIKKESDIDIIVENIIQKMNGRTMLNYYNVQTFKKHFNNNYDNSYNNNYDNSYNNNYDNSYNNNYDNNYDKNYNNNYNNSYNSYNNNRNNYNNNYDRGIDYISSVLKIKNKENLNKTKINDIEMETYTISVIIKINTKLLKSVPMLKKVLETLKSDSDNNYYIGNRVGVIENMRNKIYNYLKKKNQTNNIKKNSMLNENKNHRKISHPDNYTNTTNNNVITISSCPTEHTKENRKGTDNIENTTYNNTKIINLDKKCNNNCLLNKKDEVPINFYEINITTNKNLISIKSIIMLIELVNLFYSYFVKQVVEKDSSGVGIDVGGETKTDAKKKNERSEHSVVGRNIKSSNYMNSQILKNKNIYCDEYNILLFYSIILGKIRKRTKKKKNQLLQYNVSRNLSDTLKNEKNKKYIKNENKYNNNINNKKSKISSTTPHGYLEYNYEYYDPEDMYLYDNYERYTYNENKNYNRNKVDVCDGTVADTYLKKKEINYHTNKIYNIDNKTYNIDNKTYNSDKFYDSSERNNNKINIKNGFNRDNVIASYNSYYHNKGHTNTNNFNSFSNNSGSNNSCSNNSCSNNSGSDSQKNRNNHIYNEKKLILRKIEINEYIHHIFNCIVTECDTYLNIELLYTFHTFGMKFFFNLLKSFLLKKKQLEDEFLIMLMYGAYKIGNDEIISFCFWRLVSILDNDCLPSNWVILDELKQNNISTDSNNNNNTFRNNNGVSNVVSNAINNVIKGGNSSITNTLMFKKKYNELIKVITERKTKQRREKITSALFYEVVNLFEDENIDNITEIDILNGNFYFKKNLIDKNIFINLINKTKKKIFEYNYIPKGYAIHEVQRIPNYNSYYSCYVLKNNKKEKILIGFKKRGSNKVYIYKYDKKIKKKYETINKYFNMPGFLGILICNFTGMKIKIYDNGICPKFASFFPNFEKKNIITIKFESNIISELPRHFICDIYKENKDIKIIYENKCPTWNEIKEIYELPFYGRVKLASAKNLQLILKKCVFSNNKKHLFWNKSLNDVIDYVTNEHIGQIDQSRDGRKKKKKKNSSGNGNDSSIYTHDGTRNDTNNINNINNINNVIYKEEKKITTISKNYKNSYMDKENDKILVSPPITPFDNIQNNLSNKNKENLEIINKDEEEIYLIFGKNAKHFFTLDFRHPLSAFESFSIAVSSLLKKKAVS